MHYFLSLGQRHHHKSSSLQQEGGGGEEEENSSANFSPNPYVQGSAKKVVPRLRDSRVLAFFCVGGHSLRNLATIL